MLIAGLLAVVGLSMFSGILQRTKVAATRANADMVKQALTRFVGTYNRLPCPAVPTLPLSNSSAGLEDSSASCGSTVVAAAPTIARGVVPWRALGLQFEQVQDSYARMYTYVVTITATQTTSPTVAAMRGNMTLHSGAPPVLGLNAPAYPTGNQINSCMNTTAPPAGGDDGNGCNYLAVAVLISHGANGLGAYVIALNAASRMDLPTSAAEVANTDDDTAFVNAEPSISSTTFFDDLVYAWAPSDFLDPMTQQGALQSATAKTYDRLRTLAAAISNYAANNKTGTPNKYRIRPTLADYPSLSQNDGWGNAITYSTDFGACAASGCDICDTTQIPLNVTAFTLKSRGLDQVDGTNPATGKNDDISIAVNVEDIAKTIIASGSTCTRT